MTKWELGEEFRAYKMARESNDLTYTQWLEEMAMRYLDPLGNARQPEVVSGLNGRGSDKCPKCGGGLATFRHPGAKVNCANCGLVLQEEGGRKVYQPTRDPKVLVEALEKLTLTVKDSFWDQSEWNKGYGECVARVNEIAREALAEWRKK